MGSKRGGDKKKHKDKGRHKRSASKESRERSKSRERRSNERERSRSRERGTEKSKDRGRERSRERKRDRKRNQSTSRERKKSSRKDKSRSHDVDVGQRWDYSPEAGEPEKKKVKRLEEKEQEIKKESESRRLGRKSTSSLAEPEGERSYSPVEVKPSTSGDVVSLSIEDTNKLRISLGLKPLEVGGNSEETNEELTIEEKSRKEPILFPVKNIGEEKEAEKLRNKMETMKETRRLFKGLNTVKSLGEAGEYGDEEGNEDAVSWVAKLRKRDEAKRKADEKARLLEEMDEEFGVSDLVSEVMGPGQQPVRQGGDYSSQDLRGIEVEHDTAAFREGSDVTLVIKDTSVLDESDPVLMNLNMLESEKASKNVELRKGKSVYNPYENEEVDEFGNVIQTSVLNKYDEEIHGEKKKAFLLGEGGFTDTTAEKEREIVRQRLQEKSITLSMAPAQVASEYYSTEEMVAFKKPKKRKKLRKKEKVKADDLLPLSNLNEDKKDHGSRRRHRDEEDMETEDSETLQSIAVDLKDEADSNITSALLRTRRLLERPKTSVESTGAAKVATMLQNVTKEEEMEGDVGPAIVLDRISEFCKQVGGAEQEDLKEIARRKSSTDIHEDLVEEDNMEIEDDDDEEEEEGGWKEVKEHSKKKEKPKIDDLYQEAEPLVAVGVASALQLASKKGFVDASVKSKKAENVEVITSVGKRDVEYERQKERERDRELSRYGRESYFPEKKNYNPNVNIEYVDESGRLMNTKEAFRFMSHKFHGRTSGRKKMDKRLKKLQEEKLLSSASSTDTPLNTLSVLQSKQKSAQSPYILISGGAQSLLAPDIAKRK